MNWLDILLLLIGVAALATGFRSGLVMQLTGLLALVLGLLFMGQAAHVLIPYVVKTTGVSEFWSGIIAYTLGFILIMIIVYVLGKLVDGLFDIPILKPINKIGGMIFSFLKWMVLISFILFFIIKVDVNKKVLTENLRNNSRFLNFLLIIPDKLIQEFDRYESNKEN